MSQASSGFTPAAQVPHASSKDPFGSAYIPNEEERRVFRECNSESLWYRSLPFSAIAMGVTQVLVSRGKLTPSPRFGSLPKVVFAGICGYIGGKMSYMRVCQEKFRKLENSPLGEALRQGRLQNIASVTNQSDFSELNASESEQSGFESVSQPATEVSSMPESYSSYTSDYTYSSPSQSYDPTPFSSGFSDSGPVNIRDDNSSQDEDVPKKKPVLYEELRSKNRENYEVTLTQKAETLLKPQREVAATKEVKKNQYGDAWDE
ncbi:OCIA domain-containing protein 1 isoform X2 [Pimephales promelas]|uniref:OCIA domain-containing protein 1 isoform X2 n=1 Tax=Pimephales promelas TaxID=90988 RepID=UPI0019554E8B|nr:OCIA domain-containing protein 1 isoform X2 [Pimephales promelas]KAG1964310.1 OCIA domain-containing protein [Pimephales promelas]